MLYIQVAVQVHTDRMMTGKTLGVCALKAFHQNEWVAPVTQLVLVCCWWCLMVFTETVQIVLVPPLTDSFNM